LFSGQDNPESVLVSGNEEEGQVLFQDKGEDVQWGPHEIKQKLF